MSRAYKSYKFRAYPTCPQEGRAVRLLRDHCDIYNAALEERREAWRMRKVGVTYYMQAAELTQIRRADPAGQGRHSSASQQQTLRRLDTAFQDFFRRCKAGAKKPGFPRFRSYSRFCQVMFMNGDGAEWTLVSGGGWARARFQAVGTVKVRQHRKVTGIVKAIRLKQENRRWYVIVVAELEPVPLPSTGREVGVDVGIARFLTTSDGEAVDNPHFLASSAEVIAGVQRRMERAKPGSGNRKRLRRAYAKEHRKVRNRRRDFHHKTARALIDSCDAIALETLNPEKMTRRPRSKPDPDQPGAFLPNGAAKKRGLNRSIRDAAWAAFMTILVGKAVEAGRRVTFVNPAYTSIDCHVCGLRCARPQQKTVICPVHGAMDADVNGARNIATRAGLGSGQAAQAA